MAGHSQFKNIMHRKGKQDAVRSKLFSKLAREITVAAKMGMPDVNMNPRLRMAVLMIFVVYGLVLSIGQVVGAVLSSAPPALRLLVTIVIEVALMTWVIMPRLTRWLARWIYPRTVSTA